MISQSIILHICYYSIINDRSDRNSIEFKIKTLVFEDTTDCRQLSCHSDDLYIDEDLRWDGYKECLDGSDVFECNKNECCH